MRIVPFHQLLRISPLPNMMWNNSTYEQNQEASLPSKEPNPHSESLALSENVDIRRLFLASTQMKYPISGNTLGYKQHIFYYRDHCVRTHNCYSPYGCQVKWVASFLSKVYRSTTLVLFGKYLVLMSTHKGI
jgi:hypothetical protein